MFLRIIQHLLPRAKAWNLVVDKFLRQFFDGLMGALGQPSRDFVDEVWLDIFPETTRELDAWELQFNLKANTGLSEAARRSRLDANWKALGGQSPGYIQGLLRDNGFDVWVHESWVPGSEPLEVRNPLVYLAGGGAEGVFIGECGEAVAQCGEPTMQSGNLLIASGYPLVNKIVVTSPGVVAVCGNDEAECGEPEATCNNYTAFIFLAKEYPIPTDPATFPYYLYIGGQTFGQMATVPSPRREEFEELCLKIAPTNLWLGMLITYT